MILYYQADKGLCQNDCFDAAPLIIQLKNIKHFDFKMKSHGYNVKP